MPADWPQRLYSYPVKSTSKQRPLALGDLDGDGLVDCITADPDAAQLVLFRGTASGLAAGVAFPGLVKATDLCIADFDRDGRPEVLVASAHEKTIGVARYENGRLTFPAATSVTGEPFVLAVGSAKPGDPPDRLAYVTRQGRAFQLVLRNLPGTDETTYDISELEDDPAALRFADLDQDGRSDLLLLVRFAAPIAFLQTADGRFEEFSGAQRRAGVLKEVPPAGWTWAEVAGQGRPAVLVAQDNLVRAVAIRDGRWTVLDQYNPEASDARITGVAYLPATAAGPALVLYDRKAEELLVFRPRTDGTWAPFQSMPIGTFELTAMTPLPLGPQGAPAVLLADPSRLALVTPDETMPTLVEKHSYESEIRDVFLADSVVGDVNHDGVRDVVVLDMGKAALEILTTPPGGGFVRALRFQVFQGRRFSDAPETRGEPREVLIGDLTGDGFDDIALIAHDRLIVYPAQ